MKVNWLTRGFKNWYGQTFLYPLMRYRKTLRYHNIHLRFYHQVQDSLSDCDILMVDNTFFREQWLHNTECVIEQLIKMREKAGRLDYFDCMDSSGMPHARALPYVDRYWKSYLLKDRANYMNSYYGHRIYTDFYFKKFNIQDQHPVLSEPITDKLLLKKMGVGWSSGLANYARGGLYLTELYKRFPMQSILSIPPKWTPSRKTRSDFLFCRIGTNYNRDTLSYQRNQIINYLQDQVPSHVVSRRRYFKELTNSVVALSPFGYGEVCYRDYEVLLSGTALIKPDMSHMETWPNLYINNQTYLSHQWDLSDFTLLLEHINSAPKKCYEVAVQAQENYKKYIMGKEAGHLFVQRFYDMLTESRLS